MASRKLRVWVSGVASGLLSFIVSQLTILLVSGGRLTPYDLLTGAVLALLGIVAFLSWTQPHAWRIVGFEVRRANRAMSLADLSRFAPGTTIAAGGGGGGGPGGGRGGDAYVGTDSPRMAAIRRALDEAHAKEAQSPDLRVRIANAVQGLGADCSEAHLDCGKLVITNDDTTDFDITVAIRPNGAVPRVWLLRDGSREREFTIHPNDSVNIPVFVRTRRSTLWNVHQPHGNRAQLDPGPCYILDEAFQLSGTPTTTLGPGRHFVAVDVQAKGRPNPATVSFHLVVPSDPQKTLWIDRA